MKKQVFTGCGVALVTPFTQQGTVDFDKIDQLVEFHVSQLTDAIIACGTTGETPTMTEEEHVSVVKTTVNAVNKRIPVIAGAGSSNTAHAIHLSKQMEELGADAILSVVPYYNRPTQQGLYQHFKAIAESVTIPVILYNVPTRTGLNINPDTVKELSYIDNIVAIKECNLSQVGTIINICAQDFTVYSGNDDQVLPLLSLGGKGVISVMANIIPRDTHDMVRYFLDGNIGKSRQIQLSVLNLVKALFIEASPIPVKAAMNLMGMNVGKCRLPLTDITEAGLKTLKAAMKDYGLEVIN